MILCNQFFIITVAYYRESLRIKSLSFTWPPVAETLLFIFLNILLMCAFVFSDSSSCLLYFCICCLAFCILINVCIWTCNSTTLLCVTFFKYVSPPHATQLFRVYMFHAGSIVFNIYQYFIPIPKPVLKSVNKMEQLETM